MMYQSSPGWVGFSLFRKPAYFFRGIVILVIVQIAFLAILYRYPNSVTVPERWRRLPKPVDNVEQVEQFQQVQQVQNEELKLEG